MDSDLKLSPDGLVESYSFPYSGCCPDDICSMSADSMRCSFVSILPDGAIWTYWKRVALAGGDIPCGSIVNYAKYAGVFLSRMISEVLWPAIRESRPETAISTLDDWIDRLRWVDCYGVCRSPDITSLSPFEIMGVCEPEYCGVTFDDDFNRAYKSALVRSLSRMNMGIVGNIDSINWVLEPLMVKVSVISSGDDGDCSYKNFCLKIDPTSKTWPVPVSNCGDDKINIPVYFDRGCDRPMGLPQYAWPNLLSAECIIRSLIPKRNVCISNPFCANPDDL